MLILFGILVIIASVILGLIVLIQNPKGGAFFKYIGSLFYTHDLVTKTAKTT